MTTRRAWVWGLLMGAGAVAAGCGDDDELRDAGGDAGLDAGFDASAPRIVQVENTGAACGGDAGACRGAGAFCQRTFGQPPLAIDLPGGYCTASCTSSAACGGGAGCPLGDLTTEVPGVGELITGMVPIASTCWDQCDRAGNDPCRSGYVCRSIRDLLPPAVLGNLGVSLLLLGPAAVTPYCMPPFDLEALFDGGVPTLDGGVLSLSLDGGIDGGR